jgi:hypothetical protein
LILAIKPKAMNPNKKSKVDTRPPSELLRLTEGKGREVAEPWLRFEDLDDLPSSVAFMPVDVSPVLRSPGVPAPGEEGVGLHSRS